MIASYENMPPSYVFDANGLQWKNMRWVNTETGEGEQCVLDADGHKQLNDERTGVKTEMVKLAAPVTLIPADPRYQTKAAWDEAMKQEEAKAKWD